MSKHPTVPSLAGLTIGRNEPGYKQVRMFSDYSSERKNLLLESEYPIYQWLIGTGIDLEEWLQLAIDSWFDNDGRYVDSEIVEEFKINLMATMSLIRTLQDLGKKYRPDVISMRTHRLLKR